MIIVKVVIKESPNAESQLIFADSDKGAYLDVATQNEKGEQYVVGKILKTDLIRVARTCAIKLGDV